MSNALITEELKRFLEKRDFIYVGTSSASGHPNVAPKFLIKVEKDTVYLADFLDGKTCNNIKENPKVSLSCLDLHTLMRYQLNGRAHIVPAGGEFDEVMHLLHEREVKFSTERVIAAVSKANKNAGFEISMQDRQYIFKVEIEETVQIGSGGKMLKRLRKTPHGIAKV